MTVRIPIGVVALVPWIALMVAVTGCEASTGGGSSSSGGVCEPESDQELCALAGQDCGDASVADRCGELRFPFCGSCEAPDTCGGGGLPGLCGHGVCTPETDQELCQGQGKNCGSFAVVDQCGTNRSPECGTCESPDTCGGSGVANVCGGSGTWCTPTTAVPYGWSYLDNGIAKVGVNVDHGAAIGHLSEGGVNVLDSNDTGRYLQQSFYGDQMGGTWHNEPWPFNPVQGGSSDNVPSPVTEFCNDGVTLYAKTIPLDWGGTGSTPCVMEEWVTLTGDVASFRFRFEYAGTWSNDSRHQEVPAFFVRRDLEVLTYYEGNAPWTDGAVTQILPFQLETQGNQYINFDEPWLAYLDSNDWGVGLYKRDEDHATCYRYGDMNDSDATSYFAYLDTFGLTPGLVHEYTVYAKIGTLSELRAAFAQLYQSGY